MFNYLKLNLLAFFIAINCIFFNVDSSLAGEEHNFEKRNYEYSSTTHFGLSTEQQSSLGFKNALGTGLFLDVTKKTSQNYELGLRSSGFSGNNDLGTFYRLTAGPLVNFYITDRWLVHLTIGLFRESIEFDSRINSVHSDGYAYGGGVERIWPIFSNVQLLLGSFISFYQGVLVPINLTIDKNTTYKRQNKGVTRGIEVGFKIHL